MFDWVLHTSFIIQGFFYYCQLKLPLRTFQAYKHSNVISDRKENTVGKDMDPVKSLLSYVPSRLMHLCVFAPFVPYLPSRPTRLLDLRAFAPDVF